MVRVIVRHPDGREYAVAAEAVAEYKALGFEAVRYETGLTVNLTINVPKVQPTKRRRKP